MLRALKGLGRSIFLLELGKLASAFEKVCEGGFKMKRGREQTLVIDFLEPGFIFFFALTSRL
ncbi:hypothetical protein HW44_03585 [Nitrosococcus oceani]|nr:hypothetical protein HW44_03585 [Nitrosococcus oceani]